MPSPRHRATAAVVGVAVAMTVTMGAINYGLFPGSQELGGMLFGRRLPNPVADGPIPGGTGTAPGEPGLPAGQPTPTAADPSAAGDQRGRPAGIAQAPGDGAPAIADASRGPAAGQNPAGRAGAQEFAGAAPAAGGGPVAGQGPATSNRTGAQPAASNPVPQAVPAATAPAAAAPVAPAAPAAPTPDLSRVERGQPAQGIRPPSSSDQNGGTPVPADTSGDQGSGSSGNNDKQGDNQGGAGAGNASAGGAPVIKPRPTADAIRPSKPGQFGTGSTAKDRPRRSPTSTSTASPTSTASSPTATATSTATQSGGQQ